MMLVATKQYTDPLTEERLFAGYSALFPTGRSGLTKIVVGGWRKDKSNPMQVLAGPFLVCDDPSF